MAIPKNKDELRLAIMDQYTKLTAELYQIPYDRTKNKELPGHSKDSLMSIHNLVAYLVGWGQLVLNWIEWKNKGQLFHLPEVGYSWNQLGALAQKFYSDYDHYDFEALIQKLEENTYRILDLVEATSNTDLYQTEWYGKWSLGRLIQLNTASPFKNAKDRIRKWKKGSQKILLEIT
jgi:hypothetical protein